MTDSHTHLCADPIYQNIDRIVKSFIETGGKRILNVAYDLESIYKALEIEEKYNSLYPGLIKTSLGIHPEYFYNSRNIPSKNATYESSRKDLGQYEKLVLQNLNKLSAIGETGLDYHSIMTDPTLSQEQCEKNINIQKASFSKHLEIALEKNLSLTIHTRDEINSNKCIKDTLELVSKIGKGSLKGCFHSFTGDKDYLKDIIDLGFYVGFNGIITYKNAENVRELLKMTPLDRILVETDSPYLPPDSVRRNKKLAFRFGQPSDISEILKCAAEIKGVDVKKLETITDENFESVFE